MDSRWEIKIAVALAYLVHSQSGIPQTLQGIAPGESTENVIQRLGQWRDSLSGCAAEYHVTEESFNVLRKNSDGFPDLSLPKIKSRTRQASVSLKVSSDAVLEHIKPSEVIEDGKKQSSTGAESGEVTLLLKNGSTLIYHPQDKYAWIRDGMHFEVPGISVNLDKLILLSGFFKDLFYGVSGVQIEKDGSTIMAQSDKGDITISSADGLFNSMVVKYPHQTNTLSFQFDSESKLPSKVVLEVKAKDTDMVLMRIEWTRVKVESIPSGAGLSLSLPRDIRIDDDRNPN